MDTGAVNRQVEIAKGAATNFFLYAWMHVCLGSTTEVFETTSPPYYTELSYFTACFQSGLVNLVQNGTALVVIPVPRKR